MIFIFIFVNIVWNAMIYISFHYSWEPVLIQRILIGFEEILENMFSYFKYEDCIKNDKITDYIKSKTIKFQQLLNNKFNSRTLIKLALK